MRIELDDRVILEQEMKPFLDELAEKYPNSDNREVNLNTDDLSVLLKTEGSGTILVVFRDVSVNLDIQEDVFQLLDGTKHDLYEGK